MRSLRAEVGSSRTMARAVIQELDQRAAAGDVAAQRADRFRQRADLDVDPAVHAEVIDRAAAVRPEDAARVRIVHHHDAAVLLGQGAQVGNGAEIAVHAEDAIRDQQRALAGRQALQDGSRRPDVLVREHLDGGAAETAAVDDARVIELVGDDDIVLREDRLNRSGVGGEAALKHDGRLGLLERGQPALELHMDRHGAGDRADRAGANAER